MSETQAADVLRVPIILFVGSAFYMIASFGILNLLDIPHGVVEVMLSGGLNGALVAALITCALGVLGFLLVRQPATGRIPRLMSAYLVGVATVVLLMPAFSAVKTAVALTGGFWAEQPLADIDAIMHGGDAWRLYMPVAEYVPWVLLHVSYNLGWYVLAVATPILITLADLDTARRDRFLLTYGTMWVVLANGIAIALSSAGPVYFEAVTGEARFAEYEAIRGTIGLEEGELVRLLQDTLWENYASGANRPGLAISAFPSMHVALAALVAVYTWSLGRVAAIIGTTYLLLVQLGSVAYGWHYAIDGYFSILAVIAIWWAVGLIPWKRFVTRRDRSARDQAFGTAAD